MKDKPFLSPMQSCPSHILQEIVTSITWWDFEITFGKTLVQERAE